MTGSRTARALVRLFTAAVLVGLWLPLVVVFVESFGDASVRGWPPPELGLASWTAALENPAFQAALGRSFVTALAATAIAIVLGGLAGTALAGHPAYGRTPISLLLILPIAMPAIVTATAFNSAFRALDVDFGLATIVVGQATLCVVIAHHNVLAGARRASPPGSASLARGVLARAIIGGGLLAFVLAFDEVLVTTLTTGAERTAPVFLFARLSGDSPAPDLGAVAATLLVLTAIPAWIGLRMAGRTESVAGGRV